MKKLKKGQSIVLWVFVCGFVGAVAKQQKGQNKWCVSDLTAPDWVSQMEL